MKENIIEHIKENYCGITVLPEISIVEYTEKLIDDYHADHELDLELIIYESLALLIPPLADYIKSLELLAKIHIYETVILKAIIQYNNMGLIEDETISELKGFLETENDDKSKSILCYLLSLNSMDNEKLEYLNKSILLNPDYVLAYIELSNIYAKRKELSEGKIYLEKGMNSVKTIIDENDKINVVDYDFFVRESIVGEIVTKELFNYWQELYK